MATSRPLLISSILFALIATAATMVAAGDDIPDVFDYAFPEAAPMKIYAGPVTFNHGRHANSLGLACNACHHTLEPQETAVQEHCRECHAEPGFVRGKAAADLDEDELIEHYLNALHVQCIGCHKQKKIEDRNRNMPIGCTQCHDRSKLPAPE